MFGGTTDYYFSEIWCVNNNNPMKTKKTFSVTIDLDAFEVRVTATNKAEARKKALAALRRKAATTLIKKEWRTNRKEIDVEEL